MPCVRAPHDDATMQDTERKAQDHARIALQLLDDPGREFARCNIGLTSEMLWEAASRAIKAICVKRSRRHHEYADLREAEKRLAEETKDDSLYSGFGIACNGQLSVGSMDDDGVDADHPIARHLVDKLLAAAGVDANSC